MSKTLLILKHEITTLTSRFSFWFGILALPLIGFAIYAVVLYINQANAGAESSGAPSPVSNVTEAFTEKEDTRPTGYVDEAGIVKKFPAGFPAEAWIAYPTQAQARAALDAGKISAYIVIPNGYTQDGAVTVYMPQFRLLNTGSRSDELEQLLAYNLLDGNGQLAAAVNAPILELKKVSLAPPEAGPAREQDNAWTFFLPYGVMMLFYVAIMGSSGLLLNSISKEKENRTLEVLLLSAKPYQFLMGKILGLGIIGLFQMLVWAVSALALLRLGGQSFALPENFVLPTQIITWGVVFFILGYMVYAALMAGVGALVPNLREASQATMIVVIPLMIPLFMLSPMIQSPNGVIAVALSLFPLTAPTTMMLRLAATHVPVWQPPLAALLIALTALFVVRAVANMFRAQTLLSGQPFKVKRFFLALVGKF